MSILFLFILWPLTLAFAFHLLERSHKDRMEVIQTLCELSKKQKDESERCGMKFRKKHVVIEARGPLTQSEMITTAHGRVRAEAGDWVLTDPKSGDVWPIKPDIQIFLKQLMNQ